MSRRPTAGLESLHSSHSLPRSDVGEVLLYRGDSLASQATIEVPSTFAETVTSSVQAEPEPPYQPVEPRPTIETIHEVVGLLKVKTSMLALGACERVRKLCKAYPQDISTSPILPELIHILDEGPGTPLAAAALLALATLALDPGGRQRVVLAGGASPIIKLVARCDFARPNTGRAVQLLMNLAADAQNRRVIREAGGVEAIVAVMRVAPLDAIMEQAMGALHNVMLTDSKAKTRAVEAGVAYGLARVLALRLDEAAILAVRCRMLLADLLRIQDLQARIVQAAQEQGLYIPGMMPSKRSTATSGTREGSHTGSRASILGSGLGEPGALRPSMLGQSRSSVLGSGGPEESGQGVSIPTA